MRTSRTTDNPAVCHVVALGGNAQLEQDERPDAVVERHHVRRAAQALVPLAAEGGLLVCHGNGSQIGLLARESQDDPALSRACPLDALGARTQGHHRLLAVPRSWPTPARS